MIKKYITSLLLVLGVAICAQNLYAQTGTWTQLTNSSPDANAGVMLLLTDGTVMCFSNNNVGYGTGWDKLTPDNTGSYINGTWSQMSPMNIDRLYFSSQILPSGKIYVAGGEYSSTGSDNGEVYDPVTDTWTFCDTMPSTWNPADANSELLPNGTIFQASVYSDSIGDNLFYTPSTNAYTIAPPSLYNHDESAWLKLPDNSILFISSDSQKSNRYIPSLNKWVNDAIAPVNVYDSLGESGAAFLLPNGKAIFLGASGHNVIYTPSGDTTPGKWTVAADFPTINGQLTGQPDAPGAMMPNGKIICAVSPANTGSNFFNEFLPPTYFVEYDYKSNTFARVTSNIPGIGADSLQNVPTYTCNMLVLPDGNILFSYFSNNFGNNYWIYTPGTAAIASGKPTIDSIIPTTCSNYILTGKLFNGITEGAAYGDDWQMATNYPIVRLTNGSNVYYAKTTQWNRLGAVQTDTLEDTVNFALPANIRGGSYSLYVVANGNPSNPVPFNINGITVSPLSDTICQGSSVNLNAHGSVSYSWTPSSGLNSTIDSTITATPAVTTTYTVSGTTTGGCATSNSVVITVNSLPAKPSINKSGNTLTSSSAHGYQWELNDTIISKATGQSYTFTKSGCYSVVVTNSHGCVNTSDTDCVTLTGINQLAFNNTLSVFPNPATSELNIISNQTPITEIEIDNVLGQKQIDNLFASGLVKKSIDISTLSPGIYFYRITLSTSEIVTGKVIKD